MGLRNFYRRNSMRYLISDIHGCYEEYRELLDKIHFSDKDELYVLGDAMDRGPEPIKVIQDMMGRPNVIYIVGNHDYMMLSTLSRLAVEITEDNYENYLTSEDLLNYSCWLLDGGQVTANQFRALPREEQRAVLEYLSDGLTYEVIEEKGKQLLLVHAGLRDFEEKKSLEDYAFPDFLFERINYNRRYYQDYRKIIVTGHTPTPNIRTDAQPLIYRGNGHIAIDCGCVFGGNLAAYCVETEEAVYVKSRRQWGR